jgi:hypothetical protein
MIVERFGIALAVKLPSVIVAVPDPVISAAVPEKVPLAPATPPLMDTDATSTTPVRIMKVVSSESSVAREE